MSVYYVYILECKNNAFYTGYTTDLERRYQEHCDGKAAKFTRSFPPKRIAKYWKLEDSSVSEALKLECAIKKLSRQQKVDIIQDNLDKGDLFLKINNEI
ncbi:GIY-YIG nuclease family protein [Thiotrichales bacterium 19S3-7]|nr:GIY-YIG nuclease family protein [Thiotrichales bacterium 19S3-7]MCF6802225.1 GIY-YIG nuclease family protein [Thiotrichales bacterium 19S3-11]